METADFSPSLRDVPGRQRGGVRGAPQQQHWRPQQERQGRQARSSGRLGEVVEFIDPANGQRWTVVEQSGAHIPGARGPSCLCFEAHDIFRRVWRFPTNWRDLSDAELAALSRSW